MREPTVRNGLIGATMGRACRSHPAACRRSRWAGHGVCRARRLPPPRESRGAAASRNADDAALLVDVAIDGRTAAVVRVTHPIVVRLMQSGHVAVAVIAQILP